MRNNRYEPGEIITGIQILQDAQASADNFEHIYEGKWECCGKVVLMTHKTLLDRIRNGRLTCRSCAKKVDIPRVSFRKPKEKLPPEPTGFIAPEWSPTTAGLNWKLR